MRLSILLVILMLACAGCDSTAPPDDTPDPDPPEYQTTFIPASAQRTGDAAVGYEYLVTGNYVGRGIPLDVFRPLAGILGGQAGNVLNRSGDHADLPPELQRGHCAQWRPDGRTQLPRLPCRNP